MKKKMKGETILNLSEIIDISAAVEDPVLILPWMFNECVYIRSRPM